MTEISKLVRSFGHAFQGVFGAIASERNLRIHLTALVFVILFGIMAHLSAAHWCIVILCCMIVISLELVNTALESLCDRVTTDFDPRIRTAKNAAAGAVLVSAAGSVVIAMLLLFGDTDYSSAIGSSLRQSLWPRILLPAAVLAGILFVFLPSYIQNKNRK